MHFQRHPIGTPENLEVLKPASPLAPLISDLCLLNTRSFGAWLEPRYIFGAGQLLDQ